jgi:putative ABC transport system permease protein
MNAIGTLNTAVGLALAYLRQRFFATILNVLLLAMGVATIIVVLLLTHQAQQAMGRDAKNIDLVIGAKGSPLQIILSSIYQLDVPTGNIALKDAQALLKNPLIKEGIPLSMGDSYRGARIIGTTPAYIALYGGTFASGAVFTKPFEAVIGARAAAELGLSVGTKFVGAHGITQGPGTQAHGEHPLQVVGVLAATQTVLDRVILVNLETVWDVHAPPANTSAVPTNTAANANNHAHDHDHDDDHDVDHNDETDNHKQITALLIRYATPLAAAILPREINSQSALQAAVPAYETVRMFGLLDIGVKAMQAIAIAMIIAAALGIFIALSQALEARYPDLAQLRLLGATPSLLAATLAIEGLLLAAVGGILGVALGHIGAALIGGMSAVSNQLQIGGLLFLPMEWAVLLGCLLLGVFAALLPAVRAYRIDISKAIAGQ